MSSISGLRYTTLPLDVATLSPTTKPLLSAAGLSPDNKRIQSLHQLPHPDTRFWPPLWNALCSTSGLVVAKLDGESTSSICRTENSTIASLGLATPCTSVVALRHHCSVCRNA